MASPAQSGSNDSEPIIVDDSITRWFLGATVLWGFVAVAAGLYCALAMLMPDLRWMFGSNGEYFSFGRVRPVFASLAVYGFAGNAAFMGIYYSTQRLCNRRMFSDFLSRLHFIGWQLIVGLCIFTIPRGLTQGKLLAEAEWPIDIGFSIVWIGFFGVNLVMTIARRREKLLYISLWFYLFAFASVGFYQIANLLVTNLGSWKSDSILAGTSDALVHSVFVQNTVWQLLMVPLLGIIYYFAPKVSRKPIYSYKLAILQFWGMVLCFCWIGPAHLHLTTIPDFASSLAMIFGLMLWMPIWGGVINGLLTLQGHVLSDNSSHKYATDNEAIKFVAIGVVFLGATTFFQSLMCVKSVSAVLNYTDWVTAQIDASVFGAFGMVATGVVYWLLPRIFPGGGASESIVKLHFLLAVVGLLITTIAGYATGLWQGLILNSLNPETGQLIEIEFLNSVEQVSMLRWARIAGLSVMGAGMLVMLCNYASIAIPSIGKCESVGLAASASNEPRVAEYRSRYVDAPMLEVAKNFDIWKHLGWHRSWERNAETFFWIPMLVIAVATLFQVLPTAFFSSPKKIAQPYSPLELAGRDIFVSEGCVNCHTQMVRPLVPETKRFGDFSQRGEFAYDHPVQWGYRRVGPDLAREGGKRTSHWHWVHLQDPRDIDWCDPRSLMPSFEYLSTEPLDFDGLKDRVQQAKDLGAEYAFALEDVPMIARTQAEVIAADVVGGGGPIWTERKGQAPLMVYDSRAIALIAYLQRLGTDLFAPPPNANKVADNN